MKNPFDEKIAEKFDYNFRVSESGLYAITISARCQSGEQIQKRGGEDLRVEIDGIQNARASWNGTKLKGAKQTAIFITYLKAGEHTITFIPKEGAVVESEPQLTPIKDSANIEFNFEERAEDGDRKPWFTFVFVDLPIQSFSIDATARWHLGDSDDIKLIIDGETQKNTSILAILHRNWLWAGSVFKKLFQNERTKKTFQKTLPKAVHCIELWADKTPILHSARFNLGPVDFSEKAKVVFNSTHLRESPNTSSEILIDNIIKGEKVVILQKAVLGERARNTQGVLQSTNRWHRVKYQNQEGYIFSLALEVEGEDRQTIQQTIVAEAKAVGINAEILLALADCESNAFPYTVSYKKDELEVAFGIMQLTKNLVKDLNDSSKPFYNPIDFDNIFDIQRNVRGGVRYFNYLYNARYKDSQDRLKKSIAAYNAGPNNVPPDELFNLENYGGETKRIVPCVENHLKSKTFQKVLFGIKTGVLIILGAATLLFVNEEFMAPMVETLNDHYRAASVLQDVAHVNKAATDDFWMPSKFPAVILNKTNERIYFFSHDGNIIRKIPIDKLDYNLRLPTKTDDKRIFINHDVLELPNDVFYFLATVSSTCRTHNSGDNCNYWLYRFNVDNDEIKLVSRDIWGADYKLYLSPDTSKLAIERGVMTSICSSNSYLTVIDLSDSRREELDVIDRLNYDINAIKSLVWQDNQNIIANIEHRDQRLCSTDEPKPPRYENKIITINYK